LLSILCLCLLLVLLVVTAVVLNAAEREAYLTSFEAARSIWQRLAGMGHQAVNRHVLQVS
jgi:hypothetical protein